MTAAAIAATFVWLGMVLGISLLETPLKFRAPGVDLRTGLAIGRLVFRRPQHRRDRFGCGRAHLPLHHDPSQRVNAAIAGTAILLIQVFAIRPISPDAPTDLAGANAPRSNGHHVYIALEAGKVIALLTTGILLLIPT